MWCAAFFPLLGIGSPATALVALAGMGLIIPLTHCVQGTIIADSFPVAVRYAGTSLVLQLAPIIATALNAGGSSAGVTSYLVSICLVSRAGALVLFRPSAAQAAVVRRPAG